MAITRYLETQRTPYVSSQTSIPILMNSSISIIDDSPETPTEESLMEQRRPRVKRGGPSPPNKQKKCGGFQYRNPMYTAAKPQPHITKTAKDDPKWNLHFVKT